MPRNQRQWILIANHHYGDTWIPEPGQLWHYEILPNSDLHVGDVVYFWWNPVNEMYGWGTIAEPPHQFMKEVVGPTGHLLSTRTMKLTVSRQHDFTPHITADDMRRDSRLRRFVPSNIEALCVLPLETVRANYLNDYIRERNLEAPPGSAAVRWLSQENAPQFLVQAVLTFGGKTDDGQLVQGVQIPWELILKLIDEDPREIYNIDPRKWEELIAGAYKQAGWDDVILTPRSGDGGRDVIATKNGIDSIRIIDQVKRYRLGNEVTADEVRAVIGVLSMNQDVTKAVISTTSTFAPELLLDKHIAPLVPYRLELKPRNVLLPWLNGLRRRL